MSSLQAQPSSVDFYINKAKVALSKKKFWLFISDLWVRKSLLNFSSAKLLNKQNSTKCTIIRNSSCKNGKGTSYCSLIITIVFWTEYCCVFFCCKTWAKLQKAEYETCQSQEVSVDTGHHCKWTEDIELVHQRGMSQRTACKTFGIPRYTSHYRCG